MKTSWFATRFLHIKVERKNEDIKTREIRSMSKDEIEMIFRPGRLLRHCGQEATMVGGYRQALRESSASLVSRRFE